MDSLKLRKEALPLLVAIIGICLSSLFAYLLQYRTQHHLQLLDAIHSHIPWIAFGIGVFCALLIAVLVQISLLAHQRTKRLNAINESLRSEITQREQIEKSKQKLEVALRQGQKLQAMGTLAGGIAHDFNNILYAIIGYIEMARDDVDERSQTYKNLGKVLEAATRGRELVSRILAFSRKQHHQHDTINLRRAIETALSLLRPTIPASVNIKFEPNVDPIVLANQTQLHQVLVNIINNAVDALDGEGEIAIQLTHVSDNDPALSNLLQKTAKRYCRIDISDKGHGMDQQTLERVFEPFFTTKEVGKGSGLGLSIVHTIIKEHHGDISIESRLGQGTKITLFLPEEETEKGEA